jgi:alpha 1,2-mannosyltransferase
MRLSAQRLILASLILGSATYIYLTRPYSLTFGPGSTLQSAAASTVVVFHNSTASPPIRAFWKTWARHIANAKPTGEPIVLAWSASNLPASDEPDAHRLRPKSHVQLADDQVAELQASHAVFREALDAFDAEDAFDAHFSGRGIVTVAGGEYFGPAIVSMRMLRQTGSKLPIEAFLANWDEYEEEICETVLPSLNARCVVLSDFVDVDSGEKEDKTRFKVTHYQLKSLALLFSTFENILYLDSDSIPLIDPHGMFTKEPYISTGLVGWPDFWVGTEAPEFYKIAGMGDFPEDTLPATSSESGQLLVDKRVHLKTLLLAAYYNVWGPDWYYPLLSQGALGQGDKNTFETAAIVLGLPWYRVRTPVKALGRHDDGSFLGSGMVQFHPGDDYAKFGKATKEETLTQVSEPLSSSPADVRAAFMHANTPKMNSGHLVDEGDLKDKSSGKGLRLWGPLVEQKELFGEDLEMRAWKSVVEVGCDLASVLREWRERKNICMRLREHWMEVFTPD